MDTSPLVGDPLAPFSFYFQFNDGSGTGNASNTVTLSNFDFGVGGSATGSAVSTDGGSGDLFTTVILEDSSAFNDVYQSFTVGSLIKFDITLTTIVEGGPPDKFSFAILDSSLTNILTTDPGSQFMGYPTENDPKTICAIARRCLQNVASHVRQTIFLSRPLPARPRHDGV